MPTELRKLHPGCYMMMYSLACETEPFGYIVSPDDYVVHMSRHDGWTVWDIGDGEHGHQFIGMITLSNHKPLHDAMIHVTIDPKWHGLWLTRGHLRTVFGYAFKDLELRRVSGYSILYKTYAAGKLLSGIGFEVEGITRCGVRAPNGEFFDLVHYGMLREDCRWVKL
jgi:RimJ/RimL family protein N-acetyltransferase